MSLVSFTKKKIFKGTSFLVMLVQVYSIEIIQLGTILHTIVKPNNTCNWFLSSWLERTTPLLRFTVWCSVLIGWWEPWSLIGSGSSTIYSSSSTISSRKGDTMLVAVNWSGRIRIILGPPDPDRILDTDPKRRTIVIIALKSTKMAKFY